MPIEVIKSNKQITEAADWWAIGCIIYEMVIGISPFNAETVELVFKKIINMDIKWPPIGYSEGMVTPEFKYLV